MCGGNAVPALICSTINGTSPRVRGKREQAEKIGELDGYIPACAGETQDGGILRAYDTVHPRVCGGNFNTSGNTVVGTGTSPRVRGKLQGLHDEFAEIRYIPACAGETSREIESFAILRVHPRVCGETGQQQSW